MSDEHADRFPSSCIEFSNRHAQLDWNGLPLSEGMVIAHDIRVWGKALDVRVESTIAELWVEHHPNVPGGQVFAECDSDDGPRRVWLLRDHVGPAGSLGRPTEGMLI